MRDILKNARKEKKLSQEKIARELNITTRTYQYLEAGKVSPTLSRAFALSRILEVPVEVLFREEL